MHRSNLILGFNLSEMIIIFGDVIYYDEKKVIDYSSIIDNKLNMRITEYEELTDKSAEVGYKFVGGGIKGSKKYKGEVIESLLYNISEFENKLVGRDDYFDFTEKDGLDLITIDRGSIVKFDTNIIIPKDFELTQTIIDFKPILLDNLSRDDENESFKLVISKLLETDIFKIPIFMEIDGFTACSKILSNNLIVTYENFEDYEDLDVSVIARVESQKLVDKSIAYYDPLKDFIKINRSLRREIKDRDEGMRKIYSNEEYKKLDIISIYQ